MDAHLKNTKRRDDIVESESEVMSKRIPKKKSMKNKLKSQGGRFDFKEDKCKFIISSVSQCILAQSHISFLYRRAKGWRMAQPYDRTW